MKHLLKYLAFLAVLAAALFPAVIGTGTVALAAETASADQAEQQHRETDEYYEKDAFDGTYDDDDAIALERAFSDAFKQWETSGYPDDIGGVYYDSDAGKMGVLIVDPTPQRMDELWAMFLDRVVITPCEFSYNELRLVQEEIDSIMGAGSGIYSSGVGWTSTDGNVHGFGESGKEFRLVVGVDESVFDHYSEGFSLLYGDRVIVHASGPAEYWLDESSLSGDIGVDTGMAEGGVDAGIISPIVPVDISVALSGSAFFPAAKDAVEDNFWLWAVLGIGLVGTLLLLLMRLRSRSIPAMQTANGEIVTSGSFVGKKQVVDAVKNSAITPSDGLFARICEKIDT